MARKALMEALELLLLDNRVIWIKDAGRKGIKTSIGGGVEVEACFRGGYCGTEEVVICNLSAGDRLIQQRLYYEHEPVFRMLEGQFKTAQAPMGEATTEVLVYHAIETINRFLETPGPDETDEPV